jgi:beta-lactamase class A
MSTGLTDKPGPTKTFMKFKAPAVRSRIGTVNFRQGFCVLLLVLTSSCATQREAKSSSPLQKLVNSELAQFPGHAGVYVKNFKTGEEAGFRADEIFNSASVIKLPVAALVLEKATRGDLNLDQRIPLREEDACIGSGVLQFHDPGLQPTLRDIIFEMIITSDNTATDVAIERAGGVSAVQCLDQDQRL